MENDFRQRGRFAYNSLTDEVFIDGAPLQNSGVIDLKIWLDEVYKIDIEKGKLFDVVAHVATIHQFDPLRAYLDRIIWDGVRRIDTILIDYFKCQDTKLNRILGPKWLCSAVARGLCQSAAGVKVDQVLIILGDQGIGKSTGLAALAGRQYFSDSHLDLRSKEAYQQIHSGIWIYELAELHALRGRAAENTKMFLSAQVDRWRKPYERAQTVRARRCIFVGTSNDQSGILSDPSGSRGFWCCTAEGNIQVAALERDRDQIWAEAVDRYRKDEKKGSTWLDREEQAELEKSNSKYEHEDPWEKIVLDALDQNPDGVTITEILTGRKEFDPMINREVLLWGVGMTPGGQHSGFSRRVSGILQKHGARQIRKKCDGKRRLAWKRAK